MSARARKQKTIETEKVEVLSPQSSTSLSRSSLTVERSRTSTSGRPSFSRSERSHSPLSISRTEEKDELAHLNDRLAGYIDYVRKLEFDKERLTSRIHTVTEERMNKVEEVRKTYEDEITALRNLVDDLAKQKTKSELDAKQAQDDANNMRVTLVKRQQERDGLQRRIEELEKNLSEYRQYHDRYKPLLSDYHALEKRFEEMKRDVEAETLLRTDLENKVLGLREQLDFRNRLFDEERDKLIQRTVSIEEEITDRKQAEYENRLADELRDIRQQTASELEEYKFQLEETFENRFGHLRSSADHSAEDAVRQRSELMNERKRSEDLSHELSKKVAELELLQRRVDELQRQIDLERRDHESQMQFQRQEVQRLKRELEESFREFTELMNTKIALDQEILMYRKMLEGEESRLNLQSPSKDSPFNIQPGKRRRTDDDGADEFPESEHAQLTGAAFTPARGQRYVYRVSSSSSGPIEFFKEQDTQGKWVKLTNTSTEDATVGSWELVHEADGKETRFKFHRSLVLKPGAVCTVWSGDADATHNPPGDIVMKGKSFHAGSEAVITLLDGDNKEQAKCNVKRERIRTTGVSFGRKLPGQRSGPTDDKCLLM